MKPLHIETPLFESSALSLASGRTVWLKFKAIQPTGSFKLRGIGRACQEYVRRGARRLISSSGGNAGIAVACAGRRLSVPVVVVVPETTSEKARALIELEDAEVIVEGAVCELVNPRRSGSPASSHTISSNYFVCSIQGGSYGNSGQMLFDRTLF